MKLAEPSQGCGATASTRRASSACSSSSRGRAAARSPPPPPDPRSEHGSGGGGASSRRSARPEALAEEDCVPEPDDETLEFLSTSCDTDSSDNSGCDAACAVLEAHLERTPAPADGSAAVWAERSAVARALELAAPLREQEQTLKEVGDEAAVSTEQRRPSKLQPLELPLHQSARAGVAAAAVAQQMGSSRVEDWTLKDAGANFGSRSSVKLQPLDAPPHESARGCIVPGIVQGHGGAFDVSTLGVASTRLAHLRGICLDGLGHQKFQVAKQCWESLCAPGEVRPTSGARERMLEVLGEEYIAFCTLIEQIVHMESEWAHAPADLHRC